MDRFQVANVKIESLHLYIDEQIPTLVAQLFMVSHYHKHFF
jgi:hypothetical protein